MQKNYFLFILFLLWPVFLYAQQAPYNKLPEFLKANSVWAFADYAGLDFNSGTAMPIKTSVVGGDGEGQASVCDPHTGLLLFYSNGVQCWNRNHAIMPNGDSLLGNLSSYSKISTKQGVCIVPFIDDPNKYYLFSLAGGMSVDDSGSLFYSVIDRTMDNGLGTIDPLQKNISLDKTSLLEAMIAIPGNCDDVWLVVHSSMAANYKVYHVTDKGIDLVPKIYPSHKGFKPVFGGFLTVSPDRKKIAIGGGQFLNSSGGSVISEFDPFSGAIKNSIKINSLLNGYTAVCFSPNSNLLYGIEMITLGGQFGVVQFDVTIHDSLKINASLGKIAPLPNFQTCLKLYNDTIYLSGLGWMSANTKIDRINRPNLSGTSCDFQPGALTLLPNTQSSGGSLPTEVVYPFRQEINTLLLDTLICSGLENGLLLEPQSLPGRMNYEWQDGTVDSISRIFTYGTYWVTYKDGCIYRTDTFIVKGEHLVKPTISVENFKLGTTLTYNSYQWLFNNREIAGATGQFYTVSENGSYRVVVSNRFGCTDTSIAYVVSNIEPSFITNSQNAASLEIYPNPAKDLIHIRSHINLEITMYNIEGKKIAIYKNVDQINLTEFVRGIYFMHIVDESGQKIKVEKVIKL